MRATGDEQGLSDDVRHLVGGDVRGEGLVSRGLPLVSGSEKSTGIHQSDGLSDPGPTIVLSRRRRTTRHDDGHYRDGESNAGSHRRDHTLMLSQTPPRDRLSCPPAGRPPRRVLSQIGSVVGRFSTTDSALVRGSRA